MVDRDIAKRMRALPELAVVLPTYNEAENLAPLVEALEDLGEDLLLVVVDDDSHDGTGLVAQQLSSKFGNITVVNRPDRLGLGSALQTGLAVALAASQALRSLLAGISPMDPVTFGGTIGDRTTMEGTCDYREVSGKGTWTAERANSVWDSF